MQIMSNKSDSSFCFFIYFLILEFHSSFSYVPFLAPFPIDFLFFLSFRVWMFKCRFYIQNNYITNMLILYNFKQQNAHLMTVLLLPPFRTESGAQRKDWFSGYNIEEQKVRELRLIDIIVKNGPTILIMPKKKDCQALFHLSKNVESKSVRSGTATYSFQTT